MADELLEALEAAAVAFDAKAEEFNDVAKHGRTQMQAAVPMTVGQEFGAGAAWVRDDAARIRTAREELVTVDLGGTGIGTGLNAPSDFAQRVDDPAAVDTALAAHGGRDR